MESENGCHLGVVMQTFTNGLDVLSVSIIMVIALIMKTTGRYNPEDSHPFYWYI